MSNVLFTHFKVGRGPEKIIHGFLFFIDVDLVERTLTQPE